MAHFGIPKEARYEKTEKFKCIEWQMYKETPETVML